MMLHVDLKSHRPYLRASAGGQKLFLMLKLLPTPEAANARPDVAIAVIVDTSGSMREPAPGTTPELVPTDPVTVDGKTYNATYRGASKLDVAMEAARRLVESEHLRPEDRIALIHFDDQVGRAGLRDGRARGAARLVAAIDRLREFSGGTQMAPGLRNAEAELRGREDATRTVLLLTDGLAIDEEECREAAAALAAMQARIIALGVGEEYNEDLLADLASATQGKPYDFRDMTVLPEIFEAELGSATRQVVSDVQATVKTVRDVRLVSAARVYPSLADLDAAQAPLQLGSLEAGDHTIFILELDVPERPAVRARLAQIGVTYRVPGRGVSRRDPADRRDGRVHHRRGAGRLGGPRGDGLRPAAQRRQPGPPGDPAGRDEPGAGRQDAADRPLDDPAARQSRDDGGAGQGRGRAAAAAAPSPSAPARRSSSGRGPRR